MANGRDPSRRKPVITKGFDPSERPLVANLFWQAFQGKLGALLGPDDRACRFIESVLDPAFALSARDGEGKLLGVAGFKTGDGALVGGTMKDLVPHYGRLGALWRGLLLETLERPVEHDELCMDGIFVAPDARGQGVGTLLLDAICAEARRLGKATVRLDVIDTNPRARALYLRYGFQPRGVSKTGLLRHVFGFASSERMAISV